MMSLNSTLVRRSQRALRPGWFGFRRLASVLLLAAQMRGSQGFRLVDENGSITPFVPYEQGFVGRWGKNTGMLSSTCCLQSTAAATPHLKYYLYNLADICRTQGFRCSEFYKHNVRPAGHVR